DRCERAVGFQAVAHAGEELFDLVEHDIGIALKRQVIGSFELDILGVWDVLGEIAAMADSDVSVDATVQYECRDLNRLEQSAHVDLAAHLRDRASHCRACTPVFTPTPPD